MAKIFNDIDIGVEIIAVIKRSIKSTAFGNENYSDGQL